MAKFHANGTKKLGTMMVCITYVILCYFGSNTSFCIVLHNLHSYCSVLHHLASPCIALHRLAMSYIILHRLALSCSVIAPCDKHSNSVTKTTHVKTHFWLNPTSVEGSKTFINELRSSATGSQFPSDFVFAPPAAARTRS